MTFRLTWPAYLGAAALHEIKKRLLPRHSMSIRKLLEERAPSRRERIYRIGKDASALDAARIMLEHNVDAVVVEDCDSNAVGSATDFTCSLVHPLGICSSHDIMHAAVSHDRPLSSLRAVDAFIPFESTAYVLPDNSIEDTLTILAACRQQHAPVMSDRPGKPNARLLAVVGLGELLGLTAKAREAQARGLRQEAVERVGPWAGQQRTSNGKQ